MVKSNARQIAALSERIEENQQQLSTGIEEVQKDIRRVAESTTAVSNKQVKLQETMNSSSRQTTGKIARLEQNQNELQAGVEEVRNNTENVAADMTADIANVRQEQARLDETIQSNSRQFTNNIAVIEQNQQQWQEQAVALQENIQRMTTQLNTLGNDLSKLQDVLKGNIRELAGMLDLNDKEQIKFKEKIQQDLLAVDNSINAIRQYQEQLQNRIEDVRSTAQAMSSELPAAIEELREEMIRNRSAETEENQPPPEANTTE
jgi:DNA repair exonuclease SbcCD ATPase subunit